MPLRCFWIFLIGIILILSSSRHRAENIEKKEEETAKDVPISNEEQTENNFKLDKENESETPLDLKIETDKQIDEKNVKHENIPIIPDNTNVKFEKKSEETENENKENPQNTTESVVETSDSENLTKSPEIGNIVLEADGSTDVTLNDEKISMEEMKTTTPGVEVEMVNDPKDQEIIDKILNQSVDEPTKEDVNSTKIVDEINNTILNDSHTESKPDVLPTTNDDLTQTVIEPKTTNTVHLNKAVDSEDQETTTTTTTTTEVKTEEQNEQILEPKSKINKPEKEEEETEAVPTADKEDTTTSNDNEVENTDKQEVIVNSNKTTTANAEEKQNEENVKLEVDSIQSFEEWKKKQIQDREEAAVKETSQSPPRAIRTKKTQVNYASQDCGAKILTQNPEAKHVSAILDENKDMYMLNPCSANIWFVVELCEPIQIRQLQVANLELFSSAPHIFDISISERYPAREWRPLGTFEARNERTVQTFAPPREELMFAKYIKFEMKSHFGKEHFCPLTLIRVLGVSMVEEYEETEDKNNEKSEMGRESGEQKIIKNIHDDAAVNEDGKESGSIEKMFKIMKNAVGTLLGNGGSEQNTTNETNISNETLDEKTNKTEEDDKIDPKWESPVTLVTNKSEVAPPVIRKTPIVTLVETGDGQEVLMEEDFNPHFHSLRFLDKISRDKFTAHLCWFLELIYRVSVMSCIMQPYNNQTSADPSLYAYVLHKKVNQEQQVPPKVTEIKEKSKDFVKIEEVQKAAPLDDAVEPKKIKNFYEKSENLNENNNNNNQPKKPVKIQIKLEKPAETDEDLVKTTNIPENNNTTEVNSTSEKVTAHEVPTGGLLVDEAPTVHDILHVKLDEKCEKPHSEAEKPNVSDTISQSQPEPVADDVSDDVITDDITAVKDVVLVDDVTNNDVTTNDLINDSAKIKVVDDNVNLTSEDVGVESKEKKEKKENKEKKEVEDGREEVPALQDFTPPPEELDTKPETPEPITAIPALQTDAAINDQTNLNSEEKVVINPGTNQKESVLMRLSNRIRALEQNLSLSSDYLEDLSQRYKRQMDEMQKAFNRTKTRLTETSRRSEEKEQKQDDSILLAHDQIDELKKKMHEVSSTLDRINQHMIIRHFVLMAVESCMLVVVFIACFTRRQNRLLHKLECKERELHELLNAAKATFTNGHVKMNGSVKRETSRVIDANQEKPKKDLIIVTSKDIKDPEEVKPLLKSSSSPVMMRKKSSFKTSPIHRRKFQIKSRKTSSSSTKPISSPTLSSSTAKHQDDTLFSAATFQIGKKKKGSKHLSLKTEVPKSGNAFSFDTYSDHVVAPICAKSISPWNNTSTILSGKAR